MPSDITESPWIEQNRYGMIHNNQLICPSVKGDNGLACPKPDPTASLRGPTLSNHGCRAQRHPPLLVEHSRMDNGWNALTPTPRALSDKYWRQSNRLTCWNCSSSGWKKQGVPFPLTWPFLRFERSGFCPKLSSSSGERW